MMRRYTTGARTMRVVQIIATEGLEAGAYPRPLFSSTRAVYDTKKYTLNTPSYPLTPPKHLLNNT